MRPLGLASAGVAPASQPLPPHSSGFAAACTSNACPRSPAARPGPGYLPLRSPVAGAYVPLSVVAGQPRRQPLRQQVAIREGIGARQRAGHLATGHQRPQVGAPGRAVRQRKSGRPWTGRMVHPQRSAGHAGPYRSLVPLPGELPVRALPPHVNPSAALTTGKQLRPAYAAHLRHIAAVFDPCREYRKPPLFAGAGGSRTATCGGWCGKRRAPTCTLPAVTRYRSVAPTCQPYAPP